MISDIGAINTPRIRIGVYVHTVPNESWVSIGRGVRTQSRTHGVRTVRTSVTKYDSS